MHAVAVIRSCEASACSCNHCCSCAVSALKPSLAVAIPVKPDLQTSIALAVAIAENVRAAYAVVIAVVPGQQPIICCCICSRWCDVRCSCSCEMIWQLQLRLKTATASAPACSCKCAYDHARVRGNFVLFVPKPKNTITSESCII